MTPDKINSSQCDVLSCCPMGGVNKVGSRFSQFVLTFDSCLCFKGTSINRLARNTYWSFMKGLSNDSALFLVCVSHHVGTPTHSTFTQTKQNVHRTCNTSSKGALRRQFWFGGMNKTDYWVTMGVRETRRDSCRKTKWAMKRFLKALMEWNKAYGTIISLKKRKIENCICSKYSETFLV